MLLIRIPKTLLSSAVILVSMLQLKADPLEFKARIPQQELNERMGKIDPQAISNSYRKQPEKFAIFATVIAAIDTDSQARKIGIAPGSLAINRAGKPLTMANRKPWTKTPGKESLRWIDTLGKLHESPVEKGRIGIWHRPYRNLIAWHLAHGNRNARWDHIVISAIMSQSRDSVAAESFWARAIKKGYPSNRLSLLCGMGIALTERDAERAQAFAGAFWAMEAQDDGAEDVPHWQFDWDQVSLLTGDPKWLSLASEHPELAPKEWTRHSNRALAETQSKIHAKVPANLPPPSVLAESMKRSSFLSHSRSNASWIGTNGKMDRLYRKAIATEFQNKKSFKPESVHPSFGKIRYLWFGPKDATKNIEATIRFRVTPAIWTYGEKTDSHNRFIFGLGNRSTGKTGKVRLQTKPPTSVDILTVGANMHNYGPSLVTEWSVKCPSGTYNNSAFAHFSSYRPRYLHSSDLVAPMPDITNDVHELRIIRINNQAEAILDGKRLALIHIPEGYDDPGVYIGVASCNVKIEQLTANVLE